jgi:sugar phosphate isomerase/epimerase
MRLGYNTNGLAHHRLGDAILLLADEGFESVALTIETGNLDPFSPTYPAQKLEARRLLDALQMRRVIETGARYLLNPRKKHDPTLIDPNPSRRAIRIDFLTRAIDLAAEIKADCVSFWSGILPDAASQEEAMERLTAALRPVIAHAEKRSVMLAFEPEPGMFIDTFARFRQLDDRIRHPLFQLTVDLGHVHCIEDGTVASHIRLWGPRVVNVHIEDMVKGVHEHLMFGEGTMDYPPILQALQDVGYRGGLHVELSRHSHMAVEAVQRSRDFLSSLQTVG